MVKKTMLALGAALVSAGVLTGCGNNISSNKGTDTVKSSVKSTNTKKKASDSKADQQVTNGAPIKVGQWKYYSDFNADGTLVKVATPKKQVNQGKVNITIDSIKVYSMKPKNDDAKKIASDYFGASGVTDPYYVLQVNWSAKNSDSQELQTNGIKSIVTTNGQQLSAGQGLMDNGSGSALAANAFSTFEANGLLKSADYKSLNEITVNFDTVCTTSSFEEVAGTATTKVSF